MRYINYKINNLIFLQVISPASTQGQMTLLRQWSSRKKHYPKQKLLRKGGEKRIEEKTSYHLIKNFFTAQLSRKYSSN